jgi:hypothetical protein
VHPQDFSVAAVLQRQKVTHNSSLLAAYALRKQVLTNLITGPANWQQTVRSGSYYPGLLAEVGGPEVMFWEVGLGSGRVVGYPEVGSLQSIG